MPTWIEDANGNKCSVEYFGSAEAAQKALDSLVNCKNCINCSGCSDCSGCSGCSGCSDCSDCSHVAFLYNKENVQAVPADVTAGSTAALGMPPIPKIENIHASVLAAATQPKALDMGQWHTCDTTHCRAGWVVHLAGEAGYALERFHNTELAAMLIYAESAPALPVSPTRFHETNDQALADMKRMAELEAEIA